MMEEIQKPEGNWSLSTDTSIFNDFFKSTVNKTLEEILQLNEGSKKVLFIERDIGTFMELIGLKLIGKFDDMILFEEGCKLDTACNIVVYCTKPTIEYCSIIAQHVKSNQERNRVYYIIFIPSYTVVCRDALDRFKVLSSLNIYEIRLDFVPLERDLLSMEDKQSFQNLVLGTDYNMLSQLKRSIQRIESVYGRIKLKYAKGEMSCMLLDKILFEEKERKAEDGQVPEIDIMVMIDRTTDLYTPLCLQMTYEGHIDEYLGLNSTVVTTEIDMEGKGPAKQTFKLNNEDVVFQECRDMHFSLMKDFFPQKLHSIQKILGEKDFHKTTVEIKSYIEKIKSMKIINQRKAIPRHVNIASNIDKIASSYSNSHFHDLEMMIMTVDTSKNIAEILEYDCLQLESKERIMRLFILLNLTQGISQKYYDRIVKAFIDAFGVEELIRILNLERAGLLKRKEKLNWESISESFKLICTEVDVRTQNVFGYVFNGYSPLSIKMIEILIMKGWSGYDIDKVNAPKRIPKDEKIEIKKWVDSLRDNKKKSTILVVFIGGITYAEVSALRWITKTTGNVNFLILTTQMINGNSLVNSFCEGEQNKLDPLSISRVQIK